MTATLTANFESEFVIAGQAGFFLRNVVQNFPQLTPVLCLPNRAQLLLEKLQALSPEIKVFGDGALVDIGGL